MIGRVSLYTVLALAIVSALLLVSYFSFQLSDEVSQEASVGSGVPTAASWARFDPRTGNVIDGADIDAVRPIASITKLFTAYVAVHSGRLHHETIINWNDLYTEGRAGKLMHGDRMSLRELLFPLLLESSNDAGTALFRALESVRDNELDALMVVLNLEDTRIVDGSGLSSGNVSSASELARVYAYLRESVPLVLQVTALRMYVHDGMGWVNNNPVRDIPGFVGGKHGFTYEAGRTFVGSFVLEDTGEEVGVVLLDSEDIVRDVELILSGAR